MGVPCVNSAAIITENFIDGKKADYRRFLEHLGTCIQFSDDKWFCDRLRRSPAETTTGLTVYFYGIPEQHREMVKYFSIIHFLRRKAISTVKTYINDLIRFFNFWVSEETDAGLHKCDEFIVPRFCSFLEEHGFAESTNSGIWSSLNTFFKTMNGWDDRRLKNPFSISPYHPAKKFDYKYIPDDVALQLDNVFRQEMIALHLRCVYWLLRLIPSRISEVLGMRIDCLKRYNGNYVIFIPTWKQNGGWREPVMRSIHLEETGIAGYLIGLIKKQQEEAQRLQEYLPDCKKDALLSHRRTVTKDNIRFCTKACFLPSVRYILAAFQNICAEYNITDSGGTVFKVTTHQFRHNGVTDRLVSGFTAAQIADMTGHHGTAMIFGAYTHLDLMPETIVQKQESLFGETGLRENRYVLFGGRILNMEEKLEKRLLGNLRAHKVRGGICSDITGCESDMWNCLDCRFFVPDAAQLGYYEEQAALWREKCARFSNFPVIKGNSERNAELYERVIKKLKEDGYLL
jgi:integrase